MHEDLICPHCEYAQQTNEPEEISAMCCLTHCESCGKEFWYSVTVTREYSAYIE